MTGTIDPALFGMPGATNTGVPAGTTLTAYTGPMNITTDGTVIENKIINGQLTVDAANVTIRNCIIQSNGWWGIEGENAPNLTVANSKIIGGNLTNSGILGSGTFVGNDISHVSIGIQLTGGATIKGNYIHDLYYGSADPHYDGIAVLGGQNHVVIEHNTISAPSNNGTAAVFIDNDFGSVNDVIVRDNLMFGDPAYTVHVDQKTGKSGTITNVVIENNYLERGYYGYVADNSNAIIRNNVQWNNNADPTPYPTSLPSTPSSPSSPTPPSAPTIASFSTDSGAAGDRITSDNTLTLTGTAAASSTVKVYDGSTQIGSTTANSSGAWSYTTAALSDAAHTLKATATNSSGQTSAASSTLTVTVDTKAPVAPTISANTVNSANQVVLSGNAEASSAIKVYDGTTQVGTATTNSSGAWSLTTSALSTGSHALTAKATDAAGNVSAASSAVNPVISSGTSGSVAAPVIASFSTDSGAAGDRITNDNTLELKGTAVANSTVTIYDGSTQIGTTTADSSGGWSYISKVLTDATHTLKATAANSSGLTSTASAALNVTVDTHAPNAPLLLKQSSFFGSTTVSGNAEAGSTVKLYEGSTLLGSATAGTDGNWSVKTPYLKSGAHTFVATATDAAGNPSALSQPLEKSGSWGGFGSFGSFGTTSSGAAKSTATADSTSQVKLADGAASVSSVNTQVDSTAKVTATSSSEATLSSGSNTLADTSSSNIVVGKSGADTFDFASNFGRDAIKDLATSGPGHDTIQFSSSVFDSFASVLSQAAQSGHDVAASTGSDTFALKSTKLDLFNNQDFHFA